MTAEGFVAAVERLLWSEVARPPELEETLSVLTKFEDQQAFLLSALKDLSEGLLASAAWIEEERVSQALLWSLYVLQSQGQFHLTARPGKRQG